MKYNVGMVIRKCIVVICAFSMLLVFSTQGILAETSGNNSLKEDKDYQSWLL